MTITKNLMASIVSVALFTIFPLSPSLVIQDTDTITGADQGFLLGALAWSPNGTMLAVGSSLGVWIFDASTFETIRVYDEQIYITSIDWSPDGTQIVSAGVNRVITNPPSGAIHIWEIDSGETVGLFEGHTQTALHVRWHPDGQLIASGGVDDTLQVWEADSQHVIHKFDFDSTVQTLDWNPDGSKIVLYTRPNLTIVDLSAVQASISFLDIKESVRSAVWSPDGNRIAIADGPGRIILWDAMSGERLTRFEAHPIVRAVIWSPDGDRLASYGGVPTDDEQPNFVIKVWDSGTGELLSEFSAGVNSNVGYYTNSIAWSPDGSRLASISDEGRIYMWDGETYELLHTYDGFLPVVPDDGIPYPTDIPRPTATPDI